MTSSRLSVVRNAAAAHPVAVIAFAVVLYGIGPVFVGAIEGPATVFSIWRLWFGVPVFAVALLIPLRRGKPWPGWRSWRWALWAGLCLGIHQVLIMNAIQRTTVTDVALIDTISPLLIAVAAVPLFGERPGATFRIWTLLAIAGAAIVAIGASTGPGGDPVGMVMAAANVVFFAAFFLLSKLGRDEIGVVPFLFGVTLVAAVGVTGFGIAVGEDILGASRLDLTYAAILAVGPGCLGHFVMTWPLRYVPANVPSVMRLGQPVVSSVLAWWFLSETITAGHLLGGSLTILGVGGAMLSPSGRRFTTQHRRDAEPPSALPS